MIGRLLLKIVQTNPRLWATLPLRLVLAAVFMAHGAQKLFGLFGGRGLNATAEGFEKMGMVPGMLWATLAGSGEFFGGLLVLLGLLTRFGALNIVVVMAVAVFHVHWGKFFLPQGIEYALTLLGVALALLLSGGGALSADALIQRRSGGTRWGRIKPRP